jgi:hypothetical protein
VKAFGNCFGSAVVSGDDTLNVWTIGGKKQE